MAQPQHDDMEPRAERRRKVKALQPVVHQKHPKRAAEQALEPEDSGFEWPDPHGYGDQLE